MNRVYMILWYDSYGAKNICKAKNIRVLLIFYNKMALLKKVYISEFLQPYNIYCWYVMNKHQKNILKPR